MSTPLYQIELLEFNDGATHSTVRVQKLDSGYSTEWWVSRRYGEEIQVKGCAQIPVYAESAGDVERRCRLIANEVMDFVAWAGTGVAGVPGQSDEYRRAHAKYHLAEHMDHLDALGFNLTERTAMLYMFALQFNINNPAALIASVEGLSSVRTIHDRLAHARRLGLLDSPGKGNRRKKEEEHGHRNDDEYERRPEATEDYGDSLLERFAKRNPNLFD